MEVSIYFLATILAGLLKQCVTLTHDVLKKMGAWVFLFVQLLSITLIGFGAYQSLSVLFVVALAMLATDESPRPLYKRLNLICFTLFLSLWFLYKYSFPIFHIASLQSFLSKYYLLGLSYLGFRIIHYRLDKSRGLIEKTSTVDVLTWMFFFPAFLSGPIQRYQDWQVQDRNPAEFKWHLTEGVKRVIEGAFLKFVLADNIYYFSLPSLNKGELNAISLPAFFGFACVYTLYLYWDFAGYSSLAIGLGHFCGVKLPENFRTPLVSRNLIEFWNRWHISLSDWLREYVFYPVAHWVKRQKVLRSSFIVSVFLPPIMMFVTAGFWHGLSWGFLIFGLLHGIGVGGLAFTKRVLPQNNKWVKLWHGSPLTHLLSIMITFLYVSLTLVFFILNNEQLLVVWKRWGYG